MKLKLGDRNDDYLILAGGGKIIKGKKAPLKSGALSEVEESPTLPEPLEKPYLEESASRQQFHPTLEKLVDTINAILAYLKSKSN